jgi:hypothetical protein
MIINKLLTSSCSLLFLCFGIAQEQPKLPLQKGTVHGEYQSFHNNGQLKAEGNFFFNQRIGEWKVYNEEGEIIAKRYFDSLGRINVIVPTLSDNPVIELLNQPQYIVERNEAGYYKFQHIKEGDIVWSKRVWSFLPKGDNPDIYNFDWMATLNDFEMHEDLSNKRDIKVYKDDEFKSFYEDDEYIDLTDLKFLGVGIKKDYFYDVVRHRTDARVIGITVFAEDTTTKEIKDFTLYYPTDLRPLLVKQEIDHDVPNISNLDDIFFLNAYGEIIYEEATVYAKDDQFDPRKASDFIAFSKEIKTQVIEAAHKLWVKI